MLILAGVTISIVINDGLIDSAQSAKSQWKQAQVKEKTELDKYLDGIENYGNSNAIMLDGDGQTFYTLAPSTLSFRSSANIEDFQEVQINGETIDPSNYTITEGSTIVNLSIDYLKTLEEDDYNISVVSKTGSPSAGFSVVEPDLNEHGFYYNQPYIGNTEDILGVKSSLIFKNDGTLYLLTTDWSSQKFDGSYTIEDGIINANIPILEVAVGSPNFSFGVDSIKKLINIESNIEFNLDIDKIISDGEYIYFYDNNLNGYILSALNDPNKSTYSNILSNINEIPVIGLGNALFGSSLKNAPKIPNSITYFGEEIFCEAEFETIKLPENLTILNHADFRDCRNLKTITIPKTVKTMKDNVFQYCVSLEKIIFEGTVEEWNSIVGINNTVQNYPDSCCAWNIDVPTTEVICSDGIVSLD